jgi:hypothetical protein
VPVQTLYGFWQGQPIPHAQELQHIPLRTTAEAVESLRVLIDGEAGFMFWVEGAKALEHPPSTFKTNARGLHYIGQWMPLLKGTQVNWWIHC